MSWLQRNGSDEATKILVAVKASREISKKALVWALTHVAQPGDCVTLIVVVSGRKLWALPKFAGDCATGHWRSHTDAIPEIKSDLTDSCSQMILQLLDVYDPSKVAVRIKIVRIKIVSGSPSGAVANEAKKVEANWVVLDKHLKQEEKRCMEELHCNIVAMKRAQAKVVRLNLVGSPIKDAGKVCDLPIGEEAASEKHRKNKNMLLDSVRSSPELGTPFTGTEAGTSSVSSSDLGTSPCFTLGVNGDLKKDEALVIKENDDELDSDTESENLSLASTSTRFQPWISGYHGSHRLSLQEPEENLWRIDDGAAKVTTTKTFVEKFSKLDCREMGMSSRRTDLEFSGNLRDAISLSKTAPPGPPPLCSICQHKAPVFGKPPRFFSYAELEVATGGFSQANFLAEGGFGSVHRGVLPEGQIVAVKQHKLASSQGDVEFCSEVEVLSCAQHRNVVLLIGFCIEDSRRLLVYEYICNGSLDSHLYGRHRDALGWSARQKVAVGAAKGLRYLHEECRVGCIVHRDLRPNNILITHDYEPLVGDFGLARWQPDGELGVDTRVIGTFGYLAPEYAESGQITEKADVYSFGVVLIELITGRKAMDISRPKGQQCLTEWARPLLEENAVEELVDPRLGDEYLESEIFCMVHAASCCIRRDPNLRPRMSQVLRILEGDMIMDWTYASTPSSEPSSNNNRLLADHQMQQQNYSGWLMNECPGRFSGRLSTETPRLSSSQDIDSQRPDLSQMKQHRD